MKQSSRLPESTLALLRRVIPQSSEGLSSQLASFRNLTIKVNLKINLVSRRHTEQIVDDLIFDSVALLKFIRPGEGARVLDLGSGAGFPGLVIAAACPRALVLSVESNRRKIEFQRQAVRELGLRNVELIHARIETVDPLDVEVAVAKAFASIEASCRMISPHLAEGGQAFLPRSLAEDVAQLDWANLGFELIVAQEYQSATNRRKSQLIHIKKS